MADIEILPFIKEYQDEITIMVQEIAQEFVVPISNGTKAVTPSLDHYWVAFHAKELVGTVGILNGDSHFSILKNLFVKKAYRGKEQGIAQLLLDKVVATLREENRGCIYLGTMEQFVAAHHFYQKNGFQRIPKEQLPLFFIANPIDAVFYKKELDLP